MAKAIGTRSVKSAENKAVKKPQADKHLTPEDALDKAAPKLLHELVHKLHQDGLRKFLPAEANDWYAAKSGVSE